MNAHTLLYCTVQVYSKLSRTKAYRTGTKEEYGKRKLYSASLASPITLDFFEKVRFRRGPATRPTLKPRHRLKAQRMAPHPSVNTNTEYSVSPTGKSTRRAMRTQLVVFTCSHSRLERSGGPRSTALNVSRPMSVKCQSNGLDLRWARWN